MGNSPEKERRMAIMPKIPDMRKGYSCYYYKLRSYPSEFKMEKCTITDISSDKKLYTLKLDSDPNMVYTHIPYLYISSTRLPRTWDDYFKVGTIVRTVPNKTRAEILEIRHDKDYQALVDLKELKTGFTKYGYTPSQFYFDANYYKDW